MDDMFMIQPLSDMDYMENITVNTEDGRVTGFSICCKADRDILEKLLYMDKYPARYYYSEREE